MAQPVLVGDIGGTNIRFAVAHKSVNGLPSLEHVWRSPANDFTTFSDALAHFLSLTPSVDHPRDAVFALAGPIDDNAVKLTNKSWTVRRDELIDRFGFERLTFMNDFAAMARSIPELPDTAFKTLQDGNTGSVISPYGSIAVAGAGTGLGQALLINSKNDGWTVIPTEGGHQPYAPIDKFETEVMSHLRKKHGYVSFELICSGNGLETVFQIIGAINGSTPRHLSASEITERAKTGDSLSIDTCEFAANALMNFIGNAVLTSGAWRGAVIAGGVSQHLYPYLTLPKALERFRGKGKMQPRMAHVPLRLLVDQTAPLIGAASSSK